MKQRDATWQEWSRNSNLGLYTLGWLDCEWLARGEGDIGMRSVGDSFGLRAKIAIPSGWMMEVAVDINTNYANQNTN